MYNGWAITVCLLAPYHYAVISIFKAYREELLESSDDDAKSDKACRHTLETY